MADGAGGRPEDGEDLFLINKALVGGDRFRRRRFVVQGYPFDLAAVDSAGCVYFLKRDRGARKIASAEDRGWAAKTA